MKRGLIIAFLILLIPLAFAQTPNSTTNKDISTTTVSAGITPDSPLWTLDKMLESISLALTFDKSAKVQKEIEIARERLSEMEEMLNKNKIDDAKKAQESHDEILKDVKSTIQEDTNITNQEKIKIESEIKQHEVDAEKIKAKVEIKINGDLTDEQRTKLNAFLASLNNTEGTEIKIEIKNKKTEEEKETEDNNMTEKEDKNETENEDKDGKVAETENENENEQVQGNADEIHNDNKEDGTGKNNGEKNNNENSQDNSNNDKESDD